MENKKIDEEGSYWFHYLIFRGAVTGNFIMFLFTCYQYKDADRNDPRKILVYGPLGLAFAISLHGYYVYKFYNTKTAIDRSKITTKKEYDEK